jgi:hypothetical protein
MASLNSENSNDTCSEEVSDSDEQMSDSLTDDESASKVIEGTEEEEEEIQQEDFPTLIEPNGERWSVPAVLCNNP